MSNYTKFFLILAIGFTLFFITYGVMQKGQEKYYAYQNTHLKTIFEDTTYYDVVFIGSSRTHTTVNPKIIDSMLYVSSYNAGIDGTNFFEQKMVLEGFLEKRRPPRMVVLNIDGHSFDFHKKIQKPVQYYSYLDNQALYSVLKRVQRNTPLVKYVPPFQMLEFNEHERRNAISGLFGRTDVGPGEFYYKGYMSNGVNCVNPGAANHTKLKSVISKEALDSLTKVVELCRAKNIELLFMYAPEYNHQLSAMYEGFGPFINTVERFAQLHAIPFLRHDLLPLCGNNCYFANYGHVNTQGATAYSKVLGQSLLRYLRPSNG